MRCVKKQIFNTKYPYKFELCVGMNHNMRTTCEGQLKFTLVCLHSLLKIVYCRGF